MPRGSQTARPLLSQGSDTNMGTNAQVPSQMSLPYQQTMRSNAAASSPLSRPQTVPTVPVPQDRQCGHDHGRTHSSPISSDPLRRCAHGNISKSQWNHLKVNSQKAGKEIQAYIDSEHQYLGPDSIARIRAFDINAYIMAASVFFKGSSSQDPLLHHRWS